MTGPTSVSLALPGHVPPQHLFIDKTSTNLESKGTSELISNDFLAVQGFLGTQPNFRFTITASIFTTPQKVQLTCLTRTSKQPQNPQDLEKQLQKTLAKKPLQLKPQRRNRKQQKNPKNQERSPHQQTKLKLRQKRHPLLQVKAVHQDRKRLRELNLIKVAKSHQAAAVKVLHLNNNKPMAADNLKAEFLAQVDRWCRVRSVKIAHHLRELTAQLKAAASVSNNRAMIAAIAITIINRAMTVAISKTTVTTATVAAAAVVVVTIATTTVATATTAETQVVTKNATTIDLAATTAEIPADTAIVIKKA